MVFDSLSLSHSVTVKEIICFVALLKLVAQRKKKESGEKDAHCRPRKVPRRSRAVDAHIARRAFRDFGVGWVDFD